MAQEREGLMLSLLSPRAAGERLGVSGQRIGQLIRAGEIQAFRVGKALWAIPAAEVERLTAERAVRKSKKVDSD